MHELWERLQFSFEQSFIVDDRWMLYVKGFTVTIRVAFFALILGICIGILIAVIRTAHDSQRKSAHGAGHVLLEIGDKFCRFYLTVIRGTPMMVQLLIMYFVIFASSRNPMLTATLAFGINSGAYVAEIVRSGIQSVDSGQMEAGRSLGLNYRQTMTKIIIPQAIRNILPALGNEMITLLKDTSLVTVIGLKDITKTALNIQGITYQAFMPLVSVACVYLLCVLALSKLLERLERRMRASDRR